MEKRKKQTGKLISPNGLDISKSYMLDAQQMVGVCTVRFRGKVHKVEKDPAAGGWDNMTFTPYFITSIR
uniref:Uncharacterized protein n=1 Tax=Tanacetum cinerariifolium TaxID=118510 RepID=A0A6L2KVN2_TANCI|nr:hypothetical protein [Tanacetum cinerariifolium]